MADEPQDLEDLLQELDQTADRKGPKISVEEIMDAIGRRSFGPLLLMAGLLGMTPVAAVPGAPSTIAVITVLIAGQMLIGRSRFWLPKLLLKLSVKADKLKKTVKIARRPAAAVDKVVKPRLQLLTHPNADRAVALTSVIIASATPPLEFLPMAAFIPSATLSLFGLGLIARDGLVVLIGFVASASAAALAAYQLL